MRKFYFFAGVVCLVITAFTLAGTKFPENRLVNSLPAKIDKSYEKYYHIGFVMPKANLQKGTVYLPLYSDREECCFDHFAAAFDMKNESVIKGLDYFEAHDDNGTLRVYKFIDYLEYKGHATNGGAITAAIDDDKATSVALNFLAKNLPHELSLGLKKPFDTKIVRNDDVITLHFTNHLSNLPNRAFPTEIALDTQGNVLSASHFFFEYEVLGTADMISVQTALASLPQNLGEKIHLTNFELVYDFEDSVLMPVYRFWGHTAGGNDFEWDISALKFY